MNLDKLIKAIEEKYDGKMLNPTHKDVMLVIANRLGTENAMPMAVDFVDYSVNIVVLTCKNIVNSKRMSWWDVYDELLHIRRVYGNKQVVVSCMDEEDKYAISETSPVKKAVTDYYSDNNDGHPMYTFSQMKELGWSEAVIEDNGLVVSKGDVYLSINR